MTIRARPVTHCGIEGWAVLAFVQPQIHDGGELAHAVAGIGVGEGALEGYRVCALPTLESLAQEASMTAEMPVSTLASNYTLFPNRLRKRIWPQIDFELTINERR